MGLIISDTAPRVQYTASGSQTQFTIPFEFFADADIKVIKTASNGTDTTLTLASSPANATQYSVEGAGVSAGGTKRITLGAASTNGDIYTLFRELAVERTSDFPVSGNFPIETLNTELDKITAMIQQNESDNKFSPQAKSSTSTAYGLVFPELVANKLLTVNSGGTALEFSQEIGTYKGTDTTTTTAAYSIRDIVKSTTAGQLNNVYICIQASTIGILLTNTSYWSLIVDAYSAASSATAAAASAADALSSADDAAADLVLTNADVVSTNADVVLTNADVLLTNADVVSTNADVVSTNADVVLTNADAAATALDLIATNQDTIDTAADLVATNQDTLDTAADLVLTNADVVLTNADVVLTAADAAATALDKIATNADVVLTGADVISAAASASAAAASADAFDDVYLGSKSSDPTTDNDGDPLAAGMLYYNTVSTIMRIYSGSAWGNVAVSTASFATLAGVETFTNKTLTSPNINEIVTTSNANLKLAPNGSGLVEIKGDGSTVSGKIQLNCENNTHGVGIQSPAHVSGQSYNLTLPITAPQNNKILGVDSSGQLSFENSTSSVTVSSVSPSTAITSDQTLTITGSGFIDNPQVEFINSSGALISAPTISFTNSTTLSVTTGVLPITSYFIRVENNDGVAGRSSTAILNVSEDVAWTTASGSLGVMAVGGSISFAVVATSDSAITYAIASGALPSGYSLNTSTGAITGTENSSISSNTTYNFTISATDVETQTASRAFSITVNTSATVEYLVVGAGASGGAGSSGIGGNPNGGGGGGGGIYNGTQVINLATDSAIVVGAGGSSVGASSTGISGGGTSFIGTGFSFIAGGGLGADRGGGNSGAPQSNAKGGNSSTYGGGGGGGAGGTGGTASGSHGYGQSGGGAGLYYANFSQFGYNGYFGAGGSGAYNDGNATGGGSGTDKPPPFAGSYGAAGGAGTGGESSGGGIGGCVIIRYSGDTIFTGGTITSAGGYTYHLFTSDGTLGT
jgi:hypothetical protein